MVSKSMLGVRKRGSGMSLLKADVLSLKMSASAKNGRESHI
jgi:hypothetical protein